MDDLQIREAMDRIYSGYIFLNISRDQLDDLEDTGKMNFSSDNVGIVDVEILKYIELKYPFMLVCQRNNLIDIGYREYFDDRTDLYTYRLYNGKRASLDYLGYVLVSKLVKELADYG